jgi:NADH oxidase (H2O-forming)
VPDASELEQCRALGEQLARHLTGQLEHREIEFSQLGQISQPQATLA